MPAMLQMGLKQYPERLASVTPHAAVAPCTVCMLHRDDASPWECMTCGLQLLTARQLDIHVEEVHDSFFQAQAARSMKVGAEPG